MIYVIAWVEKIYIFVKIYNNTIEYYINTSNDWLTRNIFLRFDKPIRKYELLKNLILKEFAEQLCKIFIVCMLRSAKQMIF